MKGSSRFALVALSTATILVATADIAVDKLASNSVPRQVIRAIDSSPRAIDFLAVGNSLVAAGFDSDQIRQSFAQTGRSVIAINAGLGSSGLIEQLALARHAMNGQHGVRGAGGRTSITSASAGSTSCSPATGYWISYSLSRR